MTTVEKAKLVLFAAAIGFPVLMGLVLFLPKKWPVWLRPIIAALVSGGVVVGVALYLLKK